MNNNHIKFDDLELVDGIGPKRANWLRTALNVHTLYDLAALTLDIGLNDDRSSPSRRDIEAWIRQAQELIAESRTSVTDAENVGWRPVASFVVEFQIQQHETGTQSMRTSAHHMEADVSETWNGINPENLCRWLVKQLGQGVASTSAVLPYSPPNLNITQIRAVQSNGLVLGTAKVGQPFLGCIKSAEPFTLQVLLKSESDFDWHAAVYSAQFYARNLATRAIIHLGDTQSAALVNHQPLYQLVLPDVRLQTGTYCLNIDTTIEGEVSVISHFEIPFLEVV